MTLDENAISVSCAIDGCHARVVNATRCAEHGGQPTYEWRTSIEGAVKYIVTSEGQREKDPV